MRSRIPPSASCNKVTNLVVRSPSDFSNLEDESPSEDTIICIIFDANSWRCFFPHSENFQNFKFATKPLVYVRYSTDFFPQNQPDAFFLKPPKNFQVTPKVLSFSKLDVKQKSVSYEFKRKWKGLTSIDLKRLKMLRKS